jgi:hypothetical protein
MQPFLDIRVAVLNKSLLVPLERLHRYSRQHSKSRFIWLAAC